MRYFGFVDPSGGSSDSMTLAISYLSRFSHKAILAGFWEAKAPFNPDIVTEEFAGILREYHLASVVGDRYSAEWVRQRFSAYGINYVTSEKTKSEIFLEFLAAVNSGRVKIPSAKRLKAQLVGLERRTSRSGKDSVDHAPSSSSHDDLANAVAGALCLAAAPQKKKAPWVPMLFGMGPNGQLSDSNPRDPNGTRNLDDPFYDSGHGNWTKLN